MLRRRLLVAGVGLLVLLVLALPGALSSLEPAPTRLELSQARAQWEQLGPQRYIMELRSNSNGGDLRLRIEVHNRRLLRGVNVQTGERLTAVDLGRYQSWLPVERLFDRIELQRQRQPTWQQRVGLLLPWLAQRFSWCVVRPMQASYDPQFGYPSSFQFRQNVCTAQEPVQVQLRIIPIQ